MINQQRDFYNPGGFPSTPDDPDRTLAVDLPAVRETWWSLRSQGVRLPAEVGVIVIDGGWWR